MDIRQALLKEHSKKQAALIQEYISNDPDRFNELFNLFMDESYRISQRASWPLNLCVEQHPELIHPHFKKLLKKLKSPGLPNAVKRNTLRMLQFVTIPKNALSETYTLCLELLQNVKEPIAVRVFAMTVAAHIALKIPELKRELLLAIEQQLPHASAGMMSRSKKILKHLSSF
jgi:hypothetical protein